MNGERTGPQVLRDRTNTLHRTGLTATSSTSFSGGLAASGAHKLSTQIIMIDDRAQAEAPVELSREVESAMSRRSSRYLTAEQELSSSLERCKLEHSPQELQIEALGKVKSMLSEHVTTSREQLDKLRKLLVNREMDPTAYQAAQRERWMAEHRLVAAEELTKALEQHLSTLSSQRPVLSPSRVQAQDKAEANTTSSAPSSNPEANLARFFKATSRQRNFPRNRARRRVTVALRPRSDKGLERPRIHDHNYPLPLLLPESKPKRWPLFEIPKKSVASLPNPSSPVLSADSTTSSEPSSVKTSPPTPHPQPFTPSTIVESASPPQPIPAAHPGSGTATIWWSAPRSAEEILADADLAVAMPGYVSDLLSGLDSINAAAAQLLPPQDEAISQQPLKSKRSRSSRYFHAARPRPTASPYILPSLDTPAAPSPPSPLRKSPSKKRISALFSLPDALSSRRGIPTDTPPRSKGMSGAILESHHVDPKRPVSVSFADLPSIESTSADSRHHGDEKVLKRIRRSLSALRRN
ncbi:hypothetical protein CVT26_001800 [Gymnopilus dilepis]|uniref:Uncharacterized protein n=1 Tax=Gymnopilus dilepis TaxID=231916 RepID=A0A409Y433_9AGAR|nr:hypothetical protein CVT26_001800 [Gymnopilus dilepis]